MRLNYIHGWSRPFRLKLSISNISKTPLTDRVMTEEVRAMLTLYILTYLMVFKVEIEINTFAIFHSLVLLPLSRNLPIFIPSSIVKAFLHFLLINIPTPDRLLLKGVKRKKSQIKQIRVADFVPINFLGDSHQQQGVFSCRRDIGLELLLRLDTKINFTIFFLKGNKTISIRVCAKDIKYP